MRIAALKDESGDRLWLANAGDGPHGGKRYREPTLYEFQFGAPWCQRVLVWSNAFDDALEEAAEMVAEKWPGLIMQSNDEHLVSLYREACERHGVAWDEFVSGAHRPNGKIEKVLQDAEADLTYTESGWLISYEWTGHEVTDETILARAVEATRLEYHHLGWE